MCQCVCGITGLVLFPSACVLQPYWELSKSTASSPAKSSPSSKEKPSDKSRKFGIVIRTDTLSKEVGHYRSQLHYIKLLEGIRSAYSNYQLNLDFEGSDKFSFLLSSVLNCLSAILEVSTFQDIAKVALTFLTDCTYSRYSYVFAFKMC